MGLTGDPVQLGQVQLRTMMVPMQRQQGKVSSPSHFILEMIIGTGGDGLVRK